MKKGLFKCLTVLLFAAVLFTSCGDGTTVKTNYADYVLRVVDNDEVPVEGVTVKIAYQGAPTEEKAMPEVARSVVKVKDQVTKEDGLVKFEDLTSGTYLITLIPPFDDKTGEVTHLFSCQYIGVNPVSASKDADNVYQFTTTDFLLPKLGGTLSATVMLPSQSEAGLVDKPAGEGKEVALKVCSSGYFFPQVTGTGERKDPYVLSMGLPYAKAVTNAEGVVTFENLPLQSYTTGNNPMSISYWDMTKNQQRNGSIDYTDNGSGGSVITLGGLYPLTFDAGKVYINQPYADIMLVNTNLRDEYLNDGIFKLDSDIVLTFDTEITTVEKATLYNTVSNSYVDVVSSIGTDDAKIVTLNPSADLAYGTTYALGFIVKGAENKDLEKNNIQFTTIPDPAQPAKPAFSVYYYSTASNYVKLNVTNMNDACAYYIESKMPLDTDWQRRGTYYLSNAEIYDGTTARIEFYSPDRPQVDEALSLRLVADYNGKEVVSDVVEISATQFSLVETNVKENNTAVSDFAIASDITLTFETDVTEITSITLYNDDADEWADVVSTIGTDNKKVVTVNPVNSLIADNSYTLTYSVKSGEKTCASTLSFSTAPHADLPSVPTFTFVGTENHGSAAFTIDVQNMSKVTDCKYYVESKYPEDAEWDRTGIAYDYSNVAADDGTSARLNITSANAVVSGKTLQVRLAVVYNGKTVLSAPVNLTDGVAPNAPSVTFISNDTDADGNRVVIYTIEGTASEPSLVTDIETSVTTVTATVTDSSAFSDGSIYTLRVSIPAADSAAPGTVSFFFKDAAGNVYDFDGTTDGNQKYPQLLP